MTTLLGPQEWAAVGLSLKVAMVAMVAMADTAAVKRMLGTIPAQGAFIKWTT